MGQRFWLILLVLLLAVGAVGVGLLLFWFEGTALGTRVVGIRPATLAPLDQAEEGIYKHDFDHDGQKETLRVAVTKKQPGAVIDFDISVHLQRNGSWVPTAQYDGAFVGLNIWQPGGTEASDVLVLQTQHGKYIHYTFYTWHRSTQQLETVVIREDGETYLPIITTGQIIAMPEAAPYFSNAIFVPPSYYASQECPSEGKVFALQKEQGAFILSKQWVAHQTKSWCHKWEGG